nr:host cell division inhibitor Icd-like protein [Xenorhabdus nematophila]
MRSLASSVARICNFFSSIFSPVLVDKLNIPKTGNYTNSGTGSFFTTIADSESAARQQFSQKFVLYFRARLPFGGAV